MNMRVLANSAVAHIAIIAAAFFSVLALALGLATTAYADSDEDEFELQSVMHLPDVTDEMMDASYWVGKQQDPDAVLADRETIDALNEAGVEGDGTGLQPLKDAREYYFDQDQQQTLQDSARVELFGDPKAGIDPMVGYAEDENGQILTEEEAEDILGNYPTDGSAPDITSQYGIITTHTTMRAFPTDRMLGLTPGDKDDDNLYLSMLRVNEPVIVRTQSVDGKFLLCLSSCMNPEWVPVEDVAICDDKDQWLEAWDILPGQELVVTGYKVRTEQSRETPNTANRMLYMGTVLERVDLNSPAEALEIVGTSSAFDRHVCYLPVRDENGSYSKELALIGASAQVSEGYLPLTTANIAEVALRSLGQMYGWGGMLEANDCSGYVRDVYKCFGLELARNTTWQMNLPVRKYDLTELDDAHKAAAIAQMPLGTVLFWGGHEMIYLGQDNGKLYVISALGGIGDNYGPDYTTYQVKGVTINTLDILRGNRVSWLSTLTCANIPYISKDVDGPSLYDVAFYENSIAWPDKPSIYTGNPIEPEVAIEGLEADSDYTVSYSRNTAVGRATITVTGAGEYTGEVSHNFEIVSPSLDDAKVSVPDQVYTGHGLEPEPKVMLGKTRLTLGEDFQVTYTNNVDPGTATVKVTGAGNYTGSAVGTFKIVRASLEDAAVEVDDQLYTGEAIKPALKVTLDDVELDPYTDYRASYKDNVDIGTATVTITGKGDYTGSITATFEILQASMDNATIRVQDQIYTGKALKPEVLVSIGSVILEKGTAYEVAYKNNVEVGTATVTVTGLGSYSGEATKTFKIYSTSLTKATVKVGNATYTGKPLKPKPEVTMGTIKLVAGQDYSVAYTDNVSAGTAIVTIKGKGNFTDSTFKSFKINKATQKIKAQNAAKKLKAGKTGKLAQTKTINLKKLAKVSAKTEVRYKKASKAGGKKISVDTLTGKVAVQRGLAKGTYKVKVKLSARADANYKAAKTKTITLKIVVK